MVSKLFAIFRDLSLMFNHLLEELHESIRNHGGDLLEIPMEFSEYFSINRESKIRSWLWNVPGFRRWRTTSLDAGENLQVLNSVAYPVYEKDQPIMGIDLLWFGKRKRLVAVLDFQPLIQDHLYFDHYFQELESLKNQYPEFNSKQEMFAYDSKQYFSPWVLFCKGGISQAQETLPLIFSSFLDLYWKIQSKSRNKALALTVEEIENLHVNYDKYSAEKDPAHGLFTGFFGKDWSDKFLHEFLFPSS